MNYGNEMVGILETYEDVQSSYETNHIPRGLNTEDKKSEVNI